MTTSLFNAESNFFSIFFLDQIKLHTFVYSGFFLFYILHLYWEAFFPNKCTVNNKIKLKRLMCFFSISISPQENFYIWKLEDKHGICNVRTNCYDRQVNKSFCKLFTQEFLFLFSVFLAFSFHNFQFLLESEPMATIEMVGL